MTEPAASPDWRLEVTGPRPYSLSLAEVEALADGRGRQLPFPANEGWGADARWRGLAAARPGATGRRHRRSSVVRVFSLEPRGPFNKSAGRRIDQLERRCWPPTSTVSGSSLDHGYPLRLIVPNRAEPVRHQVAHPDRGAVDEGLRGSAWPSPASCWCCTGAAGSCSASRRPSWWCSGSGWSAALIIQHGVVSPLVVAVGAALRRVPDRGRRFLQVGLDRRRDGHGDRHPADHPAGQPAAGKALLLQNYAANLALLLGLIAVVTLVAYAVRVARDRRGPESDASSALL